MTSQVPLLITPLKPLYGALSLRQMPAPTTHPLLSIVIPAYNEALRLPRSLDALRDHMASMERDVEVIVVDDGSTDGTAEIVEGLIEDPDRLRILREPHRGKGGAVRQGMLAATGRLRMLADADLSMPPREIARFVDALNRGSDVVVGCREGAGASRIGEPFSRHLIGRLFNFVARLLGLTSLPDTQCGFKAFTADAAEQIFSRLTVERFGFDLEVLALAAELGYRVQTLPIEWHYDPDTRVRPLVDSIDMLADILRLRWRLRRSRTAQAAVADRTWLQR
jgi:dolichyl-phosphate beta-glucosyltransferase